MARLQSEKKLAMPVSESRDHIQVSATAPLTLVECGDYECSYCAQAYIIIKDNIILYASSSQQKLDLLL
jgi:protein-disulfide isomerase